MLLFQINYYTHHHGTDLLQIRGPVQRVDVATESVQSQSGEAAHLPLVRHRVNYVNCINFVNFVNYVNCVNFVCCYINCRL